MKRELEEETSIKNIEILKELEGSYLNMNYQRTFRYYLER